MKNLVFVIVLFVTLNLSAQKDWQLRKNENGINVYTREIKDKNVVEFKTSTVINANINKIFDIVRNTDKSVDWIPHLIYAKDLEIQQNKYISYQQIKMPVGFENRDIVLENEVKRNKPGIIKIVITACPERLKKKNGFVRVEDAKGFWYFKYINENKTYVMYQFYSDMQGNLPLWLENMFIVNLPYEMLLNLKKLSKK